MLVDRSNNRLVKRAGEGLFQTAVYGEGPAVLRLFSAKAVNSGGFLSHSLFTHGFHRIAIRMAIRICPFDGLGQFSGPGREIQIERIEIRRMLQALYRQRLYAQLQVQVREPGKAARIVRIEPQRHVQSHPGLLQLAGCLEASALDGKPDGVGGELLAPLATQLKSPVKITPIQIRFGNSGEKRDTRISLPASLKSGECIEHWWERVRKGAKKTAIKAKILRQPAAPVKDVLDPQLARKGEFLHTVRRFYGGSLILTGDRTPAILTPPVPVLGKAVFVASKRERSAPRCQSGHRQ